MKKIETVKGICPKCNRTFEVPKSVKQYMCLCKAFLNLKIENDEYPKSKK